MSESTSSTCRITSRLEFASSSPSCSYLTVYARTQTSGLGAVVAVSRSHSPSTGFSRSRRSRAYTTPSRTELPASRRPRLPRSSPLLSLPPSPRLSALPPPLRLPKHLPEASRMPLISMLPLSRRHSSLPSLGSSSCKTFCHRACCREVPESDCRSILY